MLDIEIPEFDDSVLQNSGKILVRFGAKWCKPCQYFNETLYQLVNENYSIFQVDVENNPELKSKYRIKAFPTSIVFKDGYEIKRFLGLKEKEIIIKYLK